jgi:hypothetical protein
MYHLLKGLHEHLTRYFYFYFVRVDIQYVTSARKEEFSVIIIGLDGAGKTVRLALRDSVHLYNR